MSGLLHGWNVHVEGWTRNTVDGSIVGITPNHGTGGGWYLIQTMRSHGFDGEGSTSNFPWFAALEYAVGQANQIAADHGGWKEKTTGG